MKTLEELGISPAPWSNTVETEKPFETNSVWDARNGCILTGGYAESLNDARLISAAPELYEALRECLAVLDKLEKYYQGVDAATYKTMAKVRAALEKAGGKECSRKPKSK